MSDQGKEVKKEGAAGFFRADSGGRGEQREGNATPGCFGSGPGGPEFSAGRTLNTRTKSRSGWNINILSVHV